MKEKDFRALSKAEQIEIIVKKGNFIAQRFYLKFRIELYALDNFFVEKWFHFSQSGVYYVEIQKNKEILLNYVDEDKYKGFFTV